MISPHIPYDPVAWGDRITTATRTRNFTLLLQDAHYGYSVAKAETIATPSPEATSRLNHWTALLRLVKMVRDQHDPITYSVTDYDSPDDLRRRLGHLS